MRKTESVDLIRVVIGVFIRDPAMAGELMARVADDQDHLAVWLEQACADGRLSIPDIGLATELFWGMVSGTLFWPLVFGEPPGPERENELVEELVSTFVGRYAPPG